MAFAYSDEDCVKCHTGDRVESRLLMSLDTFKASVHGEGVGCGDCHQGILDGNHMTTRGSGAVDCGECHENGDRHGIDGATRSRPACHDCHTRHAILGKEDTESSIYPQHLTKTCGTCHAAECGTVDYLSWLPSIRIATHGKQDFGREYVGSNCIGCHQGAAVHGEKEPVSEDKCRECHGPLGGKSRLMGPFHANADRVKQPITFVAAILYQGALLLCVCGGFRFFTRKPGKKGKTRGGNLC